MLAYYLSAGQKRNKKYLVQVHTWTRYFLCRNGIQDTKDGGLNRFVLFLFSYGICVMSCSNLILYLNYRTLGYSWHAVGWYILSSVELYLAFGALLTMFIVVFAQGPSRSPFS